MGQKNTIDVMAVGGGMMFKMGAPTMERAGGRVKVLLGETKEQTKELLADRDIRLPDIVIASTFDNYKTLLDLERCPTDVVYFAVPNYLHVPMGLDAVVAGKHILMEKPLATSVEDAKRFYDKALEAKVAVAMNSQYRHHEVLDIALRSLINMNVTDDYLKAVIGGENLGKPLYTKKKYLQGWMANFWDLIGWRPETKVAGKGKLVGDLGIHCIITDEDLFDAKIVEFDGQTYILHEKRYKPKGKTESFAAGKKPTDEELRENWIEMDMRSDEYSGDDKATASFILKTAKGLEIPGTYELSQVESGKLNDPFGNDFIVEVGFEKGIVRWYQWDPNHLEICDPDGKNVRTYERHSDPGMAGAPGRHPHGIFTAMAKGVHKLYRTIESGDPEQMQALTRREVGFAYDGQQLISKWVEKPLKPVSEYKAPELPKIQQQAK